MLIAWTTNERTTTQWAHGVERPTTTLGSLRPVARLAGASLAATAGAEIHAGQHFWSVLRPEAGPLVLRSASVFLDLLNENSCVYSGALEGEPLPLWTLLASEPLPAGTFRAPTVGEQAELKRLHPVCIDQGDPLPGQELPCTRPRLLAVSDLDQNGRIELWATEPYRWDTGLSVWEQGSEQGQALVPWLEVCVGCSD